MKNSTIFNGLYASEYIHPGEQIVDYICLHIFDQEKSKRFKASKDNRLNDEYIQPLNN